MRFEPGLGGGQDVLTLSAIHSAAPFSVSLVLGLGALRGAPKTHPGITFAPHAPRRKENSQHPCQVSEANPIGGV